ncbi:MAG: histidine kinase, partial [Bacteroidota bacterium]
SEFRVGGFGFLIFLASCFSFQHCAEPTDDLDAEIVAADDFLEDLSLWPECKSDHLDSILTHILPVLISPPESQIVEDWFTDSDNWEADFVDESDLIFHIDAVYNSLIENSEFGLACRVKHAKGRLHALIGEHPQAITEHKKALRLEQVHPDSLMLAWITLSLGVTSIYSEDLDNGHRYLESAMDIGNRLHDPAIMALSEMYSGMYKVMVGGIDSIPAAIPSMEHALELTQLNKLPTLTEVASMNLAYAQLLSGDYDGAIDFMLSEAADIQKVNRRNTYMYLNLFEAFFAKGDYGKAEEYLTLGCDMAEKANFASGELYCLQFRVSLAQALGNNQEAYQVNLLYREEKDKQTGRKVGREIEYLNQQVQLQQKEFELQSLQNTQLRNDLAWKRKRNNYLSISLFVLCVFSSSLLVMRSRNRAALAEEELKISETKIQALQSQIHPKFIIKVLSGIRNCTLNSDKIESYNYLGTFASILRIIAKNSTEIIISLDDEIALISSYLDIERYNLGNSFTYELVVDQELKNEHVAIPSMFLQPILGFVIDNGFSGLGYFPHLKIEVSSFEEGVKFLITHDGDGEKTTCRYLGETSLLLKQDSSFVLSRRLEFFKEMGWDNMFCKAETVYRNEKPVGGEIVLYMPVIQSTDFTKGLQMLEASSENQLSHV